MDKYYNNKLTLWVIINIAWVFIGSYLYSNLLITQLRYTICFIPFIIFNIMVGIIFYIKSDKKNKIYILILLALIFGIISTIFAVNKEVALYGFQNRNEGLISITFYLSLLFITTFVDKENRKKIAYAIIFTGVVQTIYSIMQIYEVSFVKTLYNYRYIVQDGNMLVEKDVWASGFTLNPNFYAAYVLMCLCYSIGMFMDLNTKEKYIHIPLIILFMFGLLIANSTSCLIGLMISMIYVLIHTIKNRKFTKLYAVTILLIFSTFICIKLDKTTMLKDLRIAGSEAKEIVKGNISDSFGTKRIYIWRKTLEIVPKNLLHGVGIDNFYYAFDGRPLISYKRTNSYDKAHNEYLQILITEGIFALLTYLLIYFKALKDSYKNDDIIYILPLIGYLVQAFFSISIIAVAPIFFIVIGLCVKRGLECN